MIWGVRCLEGELFLLLLLGLLLVDSEVGALGGVLWAVIT